MSFAANPRAPKPSADDIPQEPTGPIASDSLAAESIQDSGKFAENENADVLGVKGASSTLNTTDTSAATALRPAESGAERERGDQLGLGSDEKGETGGVRYPEGVDKAEFSGKHSTQGYVGGPSNPGGSGGFSSTGGSTLDPTATSFTSNNNNTTSASSADPSGVSTDPGSAGVRPYVDAAPNAFRDIRSEGELKPKGENLSEGDVPKTKTFTGDVGGPNDPARLAEQQMQLKDTAAGGEGVGGVRQSESETDGSTGQYDALQSERAGDQGINE